MTPVRIETLIMGINPSPSIVVLRPLEDPENPADPIQVLPIWIGSAEANAIAMGLYQTPHPRPLTHDLLVSMLGRLDATVRRVEINDVLGTIFFARITLDSPHGTDAFDARPSDAIALAVRTGAPLYVDEHVFEVASFPYLFSSNNEPEAEMAEFHRFIESVTPEDFAFDDVVEPPESRNVLDDADDCDELGADAPHRQSTPHPEED